MDATLIKVILLDRDSIEIKSMIIKDPLPHIFLPRHATRTARINPLTNPNVDFEKIQYEFIGTTGDNTRIYKERA